jgi:predicted small lipoprotein YifL
MKQRRLWFFIFVLLIVSLTACGQEEPEPPAGDEPDNEPDLSTPSPESTSTVVTPGGVTRPVPTLPRTPARVEPTRPSVSGEAPQELLDQMIDHLAAQLSVERQAISVAGAEAVTWNDGSLGCPKPGEFYTQALVPGYRVILEANGQRYNYHASEKGYFFLCAAPRPGLGGTPSR